MTIINKKLKYCIVSNISLLFIVIIPIVLTYSSKNDNKYFKSGPSEDLTILNVKINTTMRYFLLHLLILFVEIIKTTVNELANPVIEFNLCNPDKKVITEFTKKELYVLTSIISFVNNTSNALSIIVTITQIDLAVMQIIYSSLTSLCITVLLVNEKEFNTRSITIVI